MLKDESGADFTDASDPTSPSILVIPEQNSAAGCEVKFNVILNQLDVCFDATWCRDRKLAMGIYDKAIGSLQG